MYIQCIYSAYTVQYSVYICFYLVLWKALGGWPHGQGLIRLDIIAYSLNPLCTKLQIPVWSIRQWGLKLLYDKLYHISTWICNEFTFIFKIILCMQCTDYLYTEWLMYKHVYILHIHDHIYVLLYIHVHTCNLHVQIMFIPGMYRSKDFHTWYLQVQTHMHRFFTNQKNCTIPGFEPMTLCILTSCLIHSATSVPVM